MDIRVSYKATEYILYEYARLLKDYGIDVELLITDTGRKHTSIKNRREVEIRYRDIPQKRIDCTELVLPFKYHLFFYRGLPHDSVIYLPYSIYDYVLNIITKPKDQKYIIGCHGMHLKYGHIVKGHKLLEVLLNTIVKKAINMNKASTANLYCHVINREQGEYVKKTFGLRSENIFYVPIMIRCKDYHIGKNNLRKLKVLHIGGIGKDMQIVLEVIKILERMGKLDMFEFYFIGEGDKQIESEYKKYNTIHFLGMISDNEKIKLLSESDAMIVPAYETFSKAMLEGLVSGLCILMSKRNASWRDITELRIKTTIVENGEAKEYVESLIRLAERKSRGKNINPYKLINMKKTAENFDEGIVLKKVLAFFMKVMDKN